MCDVTTEQFRVCVANSNSSGDRELEKTCDPQKFMQPSPASHIHGVIHLGQSEPQLYSGSEYDADVCVV